MVAGLAWEQSPFHYLGVVMTACKNEPTFGFGTRRLSETYLDLLDCAKALLAQTAFGPVCSASISPGEQVAWDRVGTCEPNGYGGEENCGQLYLRPAGAYHSEIFPIESTQRTCKLPLAYTFELGILRCFPVPDIEDDPTSDEMMTDWGLSCMEDQAALYQALLCCGTPRFGDVAVVDWEPVGPQGGVIGGFWTIQIDPGS